MNDHTHDHTELHLPPERDLPHPDAMFASIMAAGSEVGDDTREFGAIDELAQRRRSRRWLAPLAVAAGLGLLAVGAGLSQLIGRQPNSPAQSPSGVHSTASSPTPSSGSSLPVTTVSAPTSATSNASPSSQSPSANGPSSATSSSTATSSQSSSSSAAPTTIEFDQYGKATLKYVTIERLPIPQGYNAPVSLEFVQGWYMKICVTSLPENLKASGKLPIGSGAFRSELMPNAQALNRLDDNGHQPAYPPPNSSLAVGQCATGFVSFDFGRYVDAVHDNMLLTYKNSLGDPVVTWKMHP